MSQKLVSLPLLFVAFLILFVSIYRTASVKYVFSQAPSPTPSNFIVKIDYLLPRVPMTPENPLWPAQAVIDRLHSSMVVTDLNRANLYLEDADNRLVAGQAMYEKGKVEESFVVFQKAEGYLRQSYEMAALSQNPEEKEIFLHRLAMASLKHREILETILTTCPEDGGAIMSRLLDTPKLVFEQTTADLRSFGITPPQNPF